VAVRKDVANKEMLTNCLDMGNMPISKLPYTVGLSLLVTTQKGFS